MKYKILIILMIGFPVNSTKAQTKEKIAYSNITTIGSIWGANDNVISFESINGLKHKSMFYGLGFSFDGYGSRSSPLFLQVRKNFNKMFVYVDGGINIPWRTNNFKDYESNWNSANYNLKNSFYGELGFGFHVPISKSLDFITGFGFSLKTFKYDETTWNSWNNVKLNNKYEFNYNRIALRFGFMF